MPKQYLNSFLLYILSSTFITVCHAEESRSFSQVYPILKTNCGACHIDSGVAIQAWTLDTMPSENLYEQCLGSDSPAQCTTYFKLTEGEYPWMISGNLAESQPYVNACVTEESYHIGVSIPAKLSDEDCNLIKNWIIQGTPQ
jgi:hypothetical protein